MLKLPLFFVAVLMAAAPLARATAETMSHRAENRVPVSITDVRITNSHTEIQLTLRRAMQTVCFNTSGPNSLFLLGGGKRYRFIEGKNISACPERHPYREDETLVLHFQPLDPTVKYFALIEGEGGENQIIDPGSSTTRYWNFLKVEIPGR